MDSLDNSYKHILSSVKIKHISRITWDDLPRIENPFYARNEIAWDHSVMVSFGVSWVSGLKGVLWEHVCRHSPYGPQVNSHEALAWLLNRVDDGEFVLIADSGPTSLIKHVLRWSTENNPGGSRVPLQSSAIADYTQGRWKADPNLPMLMRLRIDRCLKDARHGNHEPEHLWWRGLLTSRLGRGGGSGDDAADDKPRMAAVAPKGILTASSTQGISGEEARALAKKNTPPRMSKKAFEANMCEWACFCYVPDKRGHKTYQHCVDNVIRAQYYDETKHPRDNSPVWSEVNYYLSDVGNGKTKWKMLESETYPGKPSYYYPRYDTRRIDVIKVGPNGPEVFYDMKFGDDDPTFNKDKQRLMDYQKVAKDNEGKYQTFVVEDECKCSNDDAGKTRRNSEATEDIYDLIGGKEEKQKYGPVQGIPPVIFPTPVGPIFIP